MPPLVATTTCEASPDQVRSASATIFSLCPMVSQLGAKVSAVSKKVMPASRAARSEEHTSELQSRGHLVCRLLLEKKKTTGTGYRETQAATVESRNTERVRK